MAVFGILNKTLGLFSPNRLALSQRTANFMLAGLKTDTKARLEELKTPEKPKRPLQPFFRFSASLKPDLLKKNPNLKVTEITKHCGEEWKKADEAIKKKYEAEYKADLEKYTNELSKYAASLTPEMKELLKKQQKEVTNERKKRKLKKAFKQLNKPKRPITPLVMYMMEQAKMLNMPLREVMVSEKGKWQNLPEEQKQRYLQSYEKLKEKYNADLAAWEEKMIEEGHIDLIRKEVKENIKRPSKIKSDKLKKKETSKEE